MSRGEQSIEKIVNRWRELVENYQEGTGDEEQLLTYMSNACDLVEVLVERIDDLAEKLEANHDH